MSLVIGSVVDVALDAQPPPAQVTSVIIRHRSAHVKFLCLLLHKMHTNQNQRKTNRFGCHKMTRRPFGFEGSQTLSAVLILQRCGIADVCHATIRELTVRNRKASTNPFTCGRF